jgi:hypothetical protein
MLNKRLLAPAACCHLCDALQGPFAVPCVLSGLDLVDYTVVAMENETDPRCLLTALQCVQVRALVGAFGRGGGGRSE